MPVKTLGLPVMHKEKGEKRDFLPSFVKLLSKYDLDICLDEDYGKKMGIPIEDYLAANNRVKILPHDQVYQQDLVIVLKAPNHDELDQMKAHAGLISMLHYDSKPTLREKIKKNKIISFSMDSIVNDANQRLVVSYEQTAWGGVCTALDEMAKRREDFYEEGRKPYQVLVLGMGNLGANAGKSCFKYMAEKIEKHGHGEKIPGILLTYYEKDSAHSKDDIKKLFVDTDLLIDATRRINFSEYIITNDLIGCLKENALILDLTADPYDTAREPIQVKAIEGLPYGTLDKYVFEVDAPEYENIPPQVKKDFRRVTVSCNGWPGVFPELAMKTYEEQLDPFIGVMMKKGFHLSMESDNLYERALYRSTVAFFEENLAHN